MGHGQRRWIVNISHWNPSEDHFLFIISFLPPHERYAINRKMTGNQYMLSEVMEPHLFVIRKMKRDSLEKTTTMLTYYILDGSIYQAPQLCNVFAARIGRSIYHMPKAFNIAASKLEKIGYVCIRFIRFEDRKRALVSRLLQYTLIHDVFGIPVDKILIKRTVEGKPYLENSVGASFPNFNFNVSHHGNYVGIASESSDLVGFDIVSNSISSKEAGLDFISSFSSYFTTLEWEDIMKTNDTYDSLATFYRYWSLKEAFVKAIGAGLGFGLHRLEFNHNNWTNILVRVDGEEARDWRFWHFELDRHHWASVARCHPRDASESSKKTLSMVDFKLEDYWNELRLPDEVFTLWTVEELIRSATQDPCSC